MKYPHNWKSPDLNTCEWCGDKDWMASDSCGKHPDLVKSAAKKMNIADLKRARDAGATHEYKGNYFNLNNGHWAILPGGWLAEIDINNAHEYEEFGVKKIDFTPLNDYYADKELDIRATGEGE